MDSLTAVDWCGFRTKSHPADVMDSLHSSFSTPEYLRFEGTGKGWNGYEQSRRIEYLRKPVGLVAFGGNNGWCQVNLSGDCMDHITGDVSEVLSQLVEDLDGQYKRVDIALTTHDGSVSLETVKKAYDSNGFRIRGKYPELRAITSTNDSDGETYYIGERESPKFVRTYEKGLQLAQECSLRLAHHGRITPPEIIAIDGIPVKDIFRVELELKPKPELFPADILMNRDSYFAGAYPYLGELVAARPDTFRLTAQRKAVMTMDKALMECRRQYGDVLYTALMLHQGDISAIWDKIIGTKHSKSLLDAGVLFALPEYQ
jgi:phage replication initiation protein